MTYTKDIKVLRGQMSEPILEYEIVFTVDGKDDEDAFKNFKIQMLEHFVYRKDEFPACSVKPALTDSYEAYTGIKAEGTA